MFNLVPRSIPLLAAIAAISFAGPVYAATATNTLDVSATVTSNCAVSTTALAFGNIDVTTGTDFDTTGGISVTCTNGTAWTAEADAGGGSGATTAVRKMTSGTDLLDYALYSDSGRTTIWGTGAGEDIASTGTGVAQAMTIYGRVPSGQTSPAGAYTDTVNVTVTY
jgi:spore coat protein U-like protein